MNFQETIRQAEFLKRYKRFFADVRLNGEVMVAHVPNTGSLKSCLFDGAPCVVTESNNPERKLKATLQFIQTPTSWVGVNTNLPNALAQEAWEAGRIADWLEFKYFQREYKISKESRIDIVMAPSEEHFKKRKNLHFVEIKNVTYAEGQTALFPDAVTTRGQKHLKDLISLRAEGFGAELLFVVQRQDCHKFAPADVIDPEYGRLLREARTAGIRIRALACEIDPKAGISLSEQALALSF